MAVVLSIRMKEKNLSQLDIAVDEVKFYIDSLIVLHYLSNESKKHSVFITNHLNEIWLHSKFSEWNFVPGNKNPANLWTRPSCINQITENTIWTNGPAFLYSNMNPLFPQKQFWLKMKN